MKSRFEGEAGKRILVETLKEQKIVGGDATLAEEILTQGQLVEFNKNDSIIEQNGQDNDVYLILAGSCSIIVNGKRVATRAAGNHVGEMVAIEPTQLRSATVIADADVVLYKLAEPVFTDLAARHPLIWLSIAKELARRLVQRNALIATTHDKIRVFIISSTEGLGILHAIENAFEYDSFTIYPWTGGVFRASQYTIESLELQLDQSDFAIAIAHPDDRTITRGKTKITPRDNVLFELGLFMGRLGRRRALLLEPRGEKVKLPSDLSGLTTITYKPVTDPNDLPSALGPACNQIRKIINDLGPNN